MGESAEGGEVDTGSHEHWGESEGGVYCGVVVLIGQVAGLEDAACEVTVGLVIMD